MYFLTNFWLHSLHCFSWSRVLFFGIPFSLSGNFVSIHFPARSVSLISLERNDTVFVLSAKQIGCDLRGASNFLFCLFLVSVYLWTGFRESFSQFMKCAEKYRVRKRRSDHFIACCCCYKVKKNCRYPSNIAVICMPDLLQSEYRYSPGTSKSAGFCMMLK